MQKEGTVMKSTLHELVEIIRTKSSMTKLRELSEYDSLVDLLYKSIQEAMKEVSNGADPRDFGDITIVNLLLLGASKNFPTDEISEFIFQLQSDYHSYEECDGECGVDHDYDEFDNKYNSKTYNNAAWSNDIENPVMKKDGLILRRATEKEIETMKEIQKVSLQEKQKITESKEERFQKYDEFFENFKKIASERLTDEEGKDASDVALPQPESKVEPLSAPIERTPLPPITRDRREGKLKNVSETIEKITEVANKGIDVSSNVAKSFKSSTTSVLSMILEKVIKEKSESKGTLLEDVSLDGYSFNDVDFEDKTFNSESESNESEKIEFKGLDYKRDSTGSGNNGQKRFI